MIKNKTHLYMATIDFDLLDPGNVVYHPNYLVLCDRARNAALDDSGCSFQELWSQGIALAVSECHSKYQRPLAYSQKIVVLTRLIEASRTRLTVRHEIVLADFFATQNLQQGFSELSTAPTQKDLCFYVDMVLAAVSLNPLRATRIPEKLSEKLNLN